MSKENKIEVKKESSVAAFDQSQLAELGSIAAGANNVRPEFQKIPTLSLQNSLSESFKAGKSKIGSFFCEMKEKDYGPNPTVIPLYVSNSAGYYDDKLICSSKDTITNRDGVKCSSCPHGVYWNDWAGAKAKGLTKPECAVAFDYFFLVKEADGTIDGIPMKASFRSQSFGAGKTLAQKIAMHPKRIPCLFGYELSVEKEKKGNWIVAAGGEKRVVLTKEDMDTVIPIYKQLNEMIKANHIHDDHESDVYVDKETGEVFDNTFPNI